MNAPQVLLALLTVSTPLFAQVRDLYLVTDRKVALYMDRHLAHGGLLVGDVVEGIAHPTYRDWLKITLEGKNYDSRAKYYLGRTQFREDIARQRAELVSRIERNTDRIGAARDEIWELQSAIAAIQFDSAVEFRERVLVTTTPGQNGVPGTPTTKAVYKYRDKVSRSWARRQSKDWREEIEELEQQVDDWQARRTEDVAALAVLDYNRRFVERRFLAYETNRVSRLPQPYVVTAKTANLYDGDHLVSRLQRDQIVLVRRNHRSSRWLRVQMDNRVLDARSDRLASRQDVERDAVSRLSRLRQSVADLQADIDLASAQEKQLRSLRISLQYESRVTRAPLTIYPFSTDYAGRTLYLGTAVPREATQMVDMARARAVQRDWEGELKDVQDGLKKLRRRLASARKDLAGAEAKVAERNRRFRAIDPTEANARAGGSLP